MGTSVGGVARAGRSSVCRSDMLGNLLVFVRSGLGCLESPSGDLEKQFLKRTDRSIMNDMEAVR